MPELGHWQVHIKAVRINGLELSICKDGGCRGVVDTGTSHLGVPFPADKEVAELLTMEAGDLLDCRLAQLPGLEIELAGYTLTLHPWNYMRRLPLREGVSVSSAHGVHVGPAEAPAGVAESLPAAATTSEVQVNSSNVTILEQETVRRWCRPRLMSVRLPAPLGPKLFILGEPVLHRYYTVYDWVSRRVGFSLANNRRNTMDPALHDKEYRGALPQEVDMLLYQKSMKVATAGDIPATAVDGEALDDAVMLVQVSLRLHLRPRRTSGTHGVANGSSGSGPGW